MGAVSPLFGAPEMIHSQYKYATVEGALDPSYDERQTWKAQQEQL